MIKGKESIQEPDNPSKREKVDSIIDEKNIIKKTPPPFKNKEDYIGVTNEKTRESYDSPSDTDGCAIHLGYKHKNEEDEEYIETPPEENDSIKSEISEGITKEYVIISLLANFFRANESKRLCLPLTATKNIY